MGNLPFLAVPFEQKQVNPSVNVGGKDSTLQSFRNIALSQTGDLILTINSVLISILPFFDIFGEVLLF